MMSRSPQITLRRSAGGPYRSATPCPICGALPPGLRRAFALLSLLSLLVGGSAMAKPATAKPEQPNPKQLRANRLASKVASGYVHEGSVWGLQPVGWFLSGRMDLGVFFFKPRISGGYGRAHWKWVGLDLNPIFSSEGIGLYSGLRAALPFIDLRVGGRYRYTFRRSFLEPQQSYEREDIEMRDGPKSTYLSWEAELTTSLPLGPGNLFVELAGTYVTGVDDNKWLYEETLRIVLDPPWVWRSLVGYMLRFLPMSALRIGVMGQVVHSPGRGKLVVRAGVMARFRMAYNLELRGTFMPAVYTPDNLGLASGDSFQIGIRYLWAYRGR